MAELRDLARAPRPGRAHLVWLAVGGTALDREVIASLVRGRQAPVAMTRWPSLAALLRPWAMSDSVSRSRGVIARELLITLGAVEKHVSNIFGKLNLPATDDDHRRVLAVFADLGAGGPAGAPGRGLPRGARQLDSGP